jgi:hypothetical protein
MALHALLDHECCIFGKMNAAFAGRRALCPGDHVLGGHGAEGGSAPGDGDSLQMSALEVNFMKTTATILAALAIGAGSLKAGNWITSKTSDGSIIILDDGSVWKVDSIDRIDSQLWMQFDNIVIDDGELINTDEGEKVSATQID